MITDVSKLVFGSNLAFRKIAASGELTATGTNIYTVNHDLGYVPGFAVWIESWPGKFIPAVSGGVSNPYDYDGTMAICLVGATTDQLVFDYNGASGRKIIWRVYFDD